MRFCYSCRSTKITARRVESLGKPPAMWKLRRGFCLVSLLLICSVAAVAAAGEGSRRWLTRTGEQPLVIARGGFSGAFADSSNYAYQFAVFYGLPNLHVWCDVQLTKDEQAICFPNIKLENASNIAVVHEKRSKTYLVNNNNVTGYFSVDFTLKELSLVSLQQNIYSRAPYFDGTPMAILTVADVVDLKPPRLWLNVPYGAFFQQHNLSMREFIISESKNKIVGYISSPEVDFLRSIQARTGSAKLVFQFLGPDIVEPSTSLTYNSLRQNLKFIKTFATGILVPKTYIWRVDRESYLLDNTSLVMDAHNLGLDVFASNFVNDFPLPYNYSYDPVSEYLSFIDNGKFSVDGVLSDFPLTPSAAIDCFSHMGENDTVRSKVLVISSEGASGDYPGCTDLAYTKAVSDGVEILDCPVQVTNDQIPFCLGSVNLIERTNAVESGFSDRATTNTDLNITGGIFAFNLTWNEIQKLNASIYNPYSLYNMYRNPRYTKMGKLLQLSEFLSFAKNAPSVSGVLISIENAAYLAEKQGLGVTDLVLQALDEAGYNNQTAKRVMINSSDSAVLKKFKSSSKYELVYAVDKYVRDILNDTISEIRTFATAVIIPKASVFPTKSGLITGDTNVVPKLQAFNLSVYVRNFRNEFVSQAWDYFSDPYIELSMHVNYMEVDGIITDYPKTSARFKRNRCLGYKTLPNYASYPQPGSLLKLIAPQSMPPAEAPNGVLDDSDVVEAPLPTIQSRSPTITGENSSIPGPAPNSGRPQLVAGVFLSVISIICSAVVL